jgi:cyclohexanecarboxyl-CoA dehydrogenase
MDFDFSAAQRQLAARVRRFSQQRIAPYAAEQDKSGKFRPELFTELAEQGLLGLGLPSEYGGSGADAVSVGIALEELAAADLTVCYPVINATLIGTIIARTCGRAQCHRWLPGIVDGEIIPALCLTEPEHGTDASAIALRAVREDTAWGLVGTKTSIMLGCYATHGLVFARTGDPGARGVTAFFTELDPRYVQREPLVDLGNRAGGRATLRFAGPRVDAENVIGGLGEGFTQVMQGFDYSRALLAIMAISAARASMEDALDHARERQAFGRPLGKNQGVAFPLVEHVTQLHAARLLAYEALWRKDHGLPHRVESNMAKSWAPRVAAEAAQHALLVLGHYGWSTNHPIERRLRDVIGTQIADGTANATNLVLARHLLGREFAP